MQRISIAPLRSSALLASIVALATFAALSGACSSSDGGGNNPAGDSGVTDSGGSDAPADGGGGCTPGLVTDPAVSPPSDLSAFCAVKLDGGAIVPIGGSVAYDLNTPLFSDYAVKLRTMWLPAGQSATWADPLPLDLPVGTVITKSFGFPDDASKPSPKMTWIETRVLTRTKDGWIALPYVWDAAQTKATLKIEGEVRPTEFLGTAGTKVTASYLIPSQGQCKRCHEIDGELGLIGIKARNLNRTYKYDTGEESQLAHFVKLGWLKGAPTDATTWPKLPKYDDPATGTAEKRARAWLDVNCAHCHNEGGGARTTGLILKYEETDPRKTGICKNPIAAGKATGGLDFDIVPGQPDKSIMVFRISSTEVGIMMPELGRSVVHAEGVKVVRDWITGLSGTCPPP
jgi:uncharacterized repeat protein (TIGR03806 family)